MLREIETIFQSLKWFNLAPAELCMPVSAYALKINFGKLHSIITDVSFCLANILHTAIFVMSKYKFNFS